MLHRLESPGRHCLSSQMLLVLDTCFEACSAALYDHARGVVVSRFERMERGHAEALGPMVEGLFAEARLKPADLTRVAVTLGPGTFTGLRIGLAYAKGMALALNIPLIGINSLAATAAPHFGSAAHIAVIRKAGGSGLFYWALYRGAQEITAPALASRDEILSALPKQVLVCGSGADAFPAFTLLTPDTPDSKLFAAYAAALSPQDVVSPLYLRAPDAKQSVDAKPVVRLATANDLAVMADLHQQSFDQGWTAESFSSALSLPGAGALIVELAGTAYGLVQYHWVAGEAEINTICVSPNHRRLHFGQDLMLALVAHLKKIDSTRLFLEVAATNTAALKLYEGLGFSRMGLRRGYYADGQDAVTMSKDLAAEAPAR
jgi:tRNA threonylcarbamoyl adenosine modification protein YeaZ/ribosomal-protein-alanine acetyltransferase